MSDHAISLSDAVAAASKRHEGLLEPARRWAVSSLCWLPSDLVALVIAAATDESTQMTPVEAVAGTFWTRSIVNELIMNDVHKWCEARHTTVPVHFAESVWRFLDFLAATGRMHPDSNPLDELRRPLRCYGELGPTGRWQPDAAFDPGPCICFEPYDGPTYGEVHGPPWRYRAG